LARLFVFLLVFWYVCVCACTWALDYGACCWQEVVELAAADEEDIFAFVPALPTVAGLAAAGGATTIDWADLMRGFDTQFEISIPRL
jgi:hypothetical protein